MGEDAPGGAGGPRIKTRRTFLEGMLRLGAAAVAVAGTAIDKLVRPAGAAIPLPRPDHVVVVMFENTTYDDVVGNLNPITGAPYFNSLRSIAANTTRSTGIAHPTDPNYLALFSGSTQEITGNSDPRYPRGTNLTTPNLAAQLIAQGFTFGDYQQDLGDTIDKMNNVGVTRLELYVDGSLKGSMTTPPYSMTLDSTTLADGTHALVAKAYDVANNGGASTVVNFAISNAGTGAPLAITTSNPAHGSKITFSFNTPAGKSSKTNWIGIYPVGITPDGSPAASAWVYANSGTTTAGATTPSSGSVSFGQGVAAGNYAAWFLYNDAYGALAGPITFTLR